MKSSLTGARKKLGLACGRDNSVGPVYANLDLLTQLGFGAEKLEALFLAG